MATLKALAVYQAKLNGRSKESAWRWNSLADLHKHTKIAYADLLTLLFDYEETRQGSGTWRKLALVKGRCVCCHFGGDHLWFYEGHGELSDLASPSEEGGRKGVWMAIEEVFGRSRRATKRIKSIYLPVLFVEGFMEYLKTDAAVEYIEQQRGLGALLRENARLEREYGVESGDTCGFYRAAAKRLRSEKRAARA